MSEPSIFISIAAYREFELVKTVRDAMARAAYPDRLQFCICWQRAPEVPAKLVHRLLKKRGCAPKILC